jgi:hypothetical protein
MKCSLQYGVLGPLTSGVKRRRESHIVNSEVALGRRIALIVGVAALAVSLAINLLNTIVLSAPFGWTDVVRIALTLLLVFFVVRGSNVARWIAIVLFGAAGSLGLYYSIQGVPPIYAAIFGGLGIVFVVCAALLLLPRASRAYFKRVSA